MQIIHTYRCRNDYGYKVIRWRIISIIGGADKFSGIGSSSPRFREHCQAENLDFLSSFSPLTICCLPSLDKCPLLIPTNVPFWPWQMSPTCPDKCPLLALIKVPYCNRTRREAVRKICIDFIHRLSMYRKLVDYSSVTTTAKIISNKGSIE